MRTSVLFVSATAAVAAIGLASLASPSAAQDSRLWTVPIKLSRLNYGFYDPNYWRGDPLRLRRQHLGVDLRATSDQAVYAPISGTVVVNATKLPVDEAHLIIRGRNGEEHVLGHIASNARVGASVMAGLKIGTVKAWPNNTHLHWGVNRGRISAASANGWGWGKAPYETTERQAISRNWVNLNSYIAIALGTRIN